MSSPQRDSGLESYLERVQMIDSQRQSSAGSNNSQNSQYSKADLEKSRYILAHRSAPAGNDDLANRSAYNWDKTHSPRKYNLEPEEKKYVVSEEEYQLLQSLKNQLVLEEPKEKLPTRHIVRSPERDVDVEASGRHSSVVRRSSPSRSSSRYSRYESRYDSRGSRYGSSLSRSSGSHRDSMRDESDFLGGSSYSSSKSLARSNSRYSNASYDTNDEAPVSSRDETRKVSRDSFYSSRVLYDPGRYDDAGCRDGDLDASARSECRADLSLSRDEHRHRREEFSSHKDEHEDNGVAPRRTEARIDFDVRAKEEPTPPQLPARRTIERAIEDQQQPKLPARRFHEAEEQFRPLTRTSAFEAPEPSKAEISPKAEQRVPWTIKPRELPENALNSTGKVAPAIPAKPSLPKLPATPSTSDSDTPKMIPFVRAHSKSPSKFVPQGQSKPQADLKPKVAPPVPTKTGNIKSKLDIFQSKSIPMDTKHVLPEGKMHLRSGNVSYMDSAKNNTPLPKKIAPERPAALAQPQKDYISSILGQNMTSTKQAHVGKPIVPVKHARVNRVLEESDGDTLDELQSIKLRRTPSPVKIRQDEPSLNINLKSAPKVPSRKPSIPEALLKKDSLSRAERVPGARPGTPEALKVTLNKATSVPKPAEPVPEALARGTELNKAAPVQKAAEKVPEALLTIKKLRSPTKIPQPEEEVPEGLQKKLKPTVPQRKVSKEELEAILAMKSIRSAKKPAPIPTKGTPLKDIDTRPSVTPVSAKGSPEASPSPTPTKSRARGPPRRVPSKYKA